MNLSENLFKQPSDPISKLYTLSQLQLENRLDKAMYHLMFRNKLSHLVMYSLLGCIFTAYPFYCSFVLSPYLASAKFKIVGIDEIVNFKLMRLCS